MAGGRPADRGERPGEAIGGQEGGGREARIGKGGDEALHHVRADHVRAIARDPPARQVEPVRRLGLRRDATRADVIAEGRRIADGGARIAADHVEPSERTTREILGLEVIGRDLVGDRRQEAADQTHVVIPGQPRDAAVALLDLHPMAVRGQIVKQRMMGDRHAMRETGRTAGILQIGDRVRLSFGKRSLGRRTLGEAVPVDALDACGLGGGPGHLRQFGGVSWV